MAVSGQYESWPSIRTIEGTAPHTTSLRGEEGTAVVLLLGNSTVTLHHHHHLFLFIALSSSTLLLCLITSPVH